ncbi:hypothetical protein BLS_008862 [Venturia inaequalis]|uniref:C6 zinc finger domain-containing protein n=1 Tax=Venturia inaequalis TaxID=5025 RepID=A0A8H3U6L4_VENIN|nr:hypothetical protein BLS_008862 [Venturia inaequalis]
MAPIHDWNVTFLDESREIASEYRDGLSKYMALEKRPSRTRHTENGLGFDFSGPVIAPPFHHQQALPPIQGMLPDSFPNDPVSLNFDTQQRQAHHQHTHSHSESTYSGSNIPTTAGTSYGSAEQHLVTSADGRDYVRDPNEVLYMQVFVEEVGLWMDSMDADKHFSELLPFNSLNNEMLYNAFLACGARHLALVNPKYSDDVALQYYNTATSYLLQNLQDENRNCVMCATTAVILNVYEIMSERALQRMNHIAGARALIKECGWNARSHGVGAACFWLNVGMELLSCLHYNWPVAWDPDDWGVDMDFTRPENGQGKEEIWCHRMVNILARVANFRSQIPLLGATNSPRSEHIQRQTRFNEWQQLKNLADSWNRHVPRTMHPLGYLESFQTTSRSCFPEVWLIKRTSMYARLLYHTAMVLLAQTNPIGPVSTSREMRDMQQENAMLICGIVAHVKDRGVASVAIRSIAIASECLLERRQQEEVIRILEKISHETGWRVTFLYKELPEKWGWPGPYVPQAQQQQAQQQPTPIQQQNMPAAPPPPAPPPPQQHTQRPPPQHQHAQHARLQHHQNLHQSFHQPQPQPHPQQHHPPPQVTIPQPPNVSLPPVATQPPPPVSRPRNPLMTADFSMPQHPYQSYYVAPNSALARQGQMQASYY